MTGSAFKYNTNNLAGAWGTFMDSERAALGRIACALLSTVGQVGMLRRNSLLVRRFFFYPHEHGSLCMSSGLAEN